MPSIFIILPQTIHPAKTVSKPGPTSPVSGKGIKGGFSDHLFSS